MALVEPGTLVLVIDDDVEVRLGVAEVLAMEGYEVRVAPSADIAWNELAQGMRPAGIVLDLWLQGMSSGEFLLRLRASPNAGVPVLVLSGGSTETIPVDVDAVAHKPIETATLVSAVDKLVAQRSTTRLDRAGAPARPPRRPARRSRNHPPPAVTARRRPRV